MMEVRWKQNVESEYALSVFLNRVANSTLPFSQATQYTEHIHSAPYEQQHYSEPHAYNMSSDIQREPATTSEPPGLDHRPLVDEIQRLRKLVEELETRVGEAENRYMDLASTEVEPVRQLRLYKKARHREFEDIERKIRTLHSTSKDQEERLGTLSTQLKDTAAEIEKWNKDSTQAPPTEVAVNRTDLTKLVDQVNNTKKKYEASQNEVKDYLTNIKILEQVISPSDPMEDTDQDLAVTLKSKIGLMEILSGVTCLEHASRGKSDTFVCKQVGNNGRIQYKLEFFKDDDIAAKVQYTPLVLDAVEEQFLPLVKDSLEFDRNVTHVFFWRLNTYLNKKINKGS
ncbi:hypothetical protein [Absidia glauca]|uniref:Monopolin complex subunit Csm1/Pcs1 C-terminal domain-containing protein n=1 Tax=Absidia glauca TaxID=4829 RepID=A0A168MUN1_ABSGL|nr:hypothetical protein [Absidia glauca]